MFNIPKRKDSNEIIEDDFDDAALEDELEAILSGKQPARSTGSTEQWRPQRLTTNQPTRSVVSAPARPPQPKKQNLPEFDFETLKNLNLDDKLDDDDFDEDDPELNAQLAPIVGGEQLPSYSPAKKVSNYSPNPFEQLPPLIPSRPAPNYQPSINQNAQQINASSNCVILDNSHFLNKPPSIIEQTKKSGQDGLKEQLFKWKDEYKTLAVSAKQNNDIDTAKAYLMKIKEIESAIESLQAGQQVDLSILNPSNSINQRINRPVDSKSSDSDVRRSSKVSESANTMLETLNKHKQKLEATLLKEQAANNTSKVRMITRLIKQYDNAIKANKAGRSFDYSSLPEIPGFDELPLNSLPKATASNQSTHLNNQSNKPVPQLANQSTQVVQQTKSSDELKQLELIRDKFKTLALDAKRNGDLENAKINLQKMKEINLKIDKLKDNQSNELISTGAQGSNEIRDEEELTDEQTRRLFNAPPPAQTVLEALEQRKNKFQSTLEKEQANNNATKVKMMTRILKQYEQAIKANKMGKEFDYDSLPVPPGFGELPSNNQIQNKPSTITQSDQKPSNPAPQPSTVPTRPKPPFKRAISINNKQLNYLLQRQKLFKEAAVASNKSGDTTQALDYLRKAKGFIPLIDAVKNGLPIDVTNIPTPPQLDGDDFVMVSKSSENLNLDLDTAEHYRKLELELEKQIALCNKNKEHFFKIGDVSTGSKFEKYLISMKQDFDMLKTYKQRGEEVPKYHYELKEFSIVVCNMDVSNNEVLFEIIRAIDLPCKQPVDSYVKFEFPFPKDSPQSARTHSAKNTLDPEYNQFFKFSIDRKARSLARVFSKSIKMEIYSKGGFFKSDELIGHVNVDLSSLRTKCTIFDSFPILSGRKEIGGKLQVRIKLKEPLLAKQVEEIKEKWLYIDLK